jgi:hypothetical protein
LAVAAEEGLAVAVLGEDNLPGPLFYLSGEKREWCGVRIDLYLSLTDSFNEQPPIQLQARNFS